MIKLIYPYLSMTSHNNIIPKGPAPEAEGVGPGAALLEVLLEALTSTTTPKTSRIFITGWHIRFFTIWTPSPLPAPLPPYERTSMSCVFRSTGVKKSYTTYVIDIRPIRLITQPFDATSRQAEKNRSYSPQYEAIFQRSSALKFQKCLPLNNL